MQASGLGHNDTVRVFVAAGVNVNAADGSGWTVLMICAGSAGRASTVQMLLAAGPDVNAKERPRADGAAAGGSLW